MGSDFARHSVLWPLKEDQFSHLSARDQRAISTLLARISESSFRRGFQHGRELDPARDRKSVYDFRFRQDLNNATSIDGFAKMTANERLDCRYGNRLDSVGIILPANKLFGRTLPARGAG